jgi:hypothetical protein
LFDYRELARMQDRDLRRRDLDERIAERRGTAHPLGLRARTARRLFALAEAVERRETWKMVWERLEAK